MTGGFHTKSSANWLIGEFPPHKIPAFFVENAVVVSFQQTTPELTELKRKHPPSSLARVWVGAGGSAFFGKTQRRSQLVEGPVWTVCVQMVFCCLVELFFSWIACGVVATIWRWFGWIAWGQGCKSLVFVMPRCELSPVSYCRLVVVRAMSGLNANQDKLTMYFFVYWTHIYIYIYIMKLYNIHILNLHHWIFCGFVFFNSYLVNTFSDRRPW